MAVSRIVMAMWDKWVDHTFAKRYVDDVTAIVDTLKMGARWTMPRPRVANVSDVFVSDEF